MTKRSAFMVRGVATLGLCFTTPFPALAQPLSPERFYTGRNINLIVPSTVGGAYDITARLVARHLARHIPGKPSIVVQNQASGAAGIALANRFANYASKLRFEDLPAPIVHEAKRRLIDSFATAVGCRAGSARRPRRYLGREPNGPAGRGGSHDIISGRGPRWPSSLTQTRCDEASRQPVSAFLGCPGPSERKR